MSDLVGNPEDRFSRVAAQVMVPSLLITVLSTFLFQNLFVAVTGDAQFIPPISIRYWALSKGAYRFFFSFYLLTYFCLFLSSFIFSNFYL